MRSHATIVFLCRDSDRTFPRFDVTNKNVIRFDQEGFLPCHFPPGKWRFVNRVQWWDDYQDDVAVVIVGSLLIVAGAANCWL